LQNCSFFLLRVYVFFDEGTEINGLDDDLLPGVCVQTNCRVLAEHTRVRLDAITARNWADNHTHCAANHERVVGLKCNPICDAERTREFFDI